MSTASPFDRSLLDAYAAAGVITAAGESVHLPSACPKATSCWRGIAADHHPPFARPASQMSPPWIGSKYEHGGILVVLENLRDYGGFDLGSTAPPTSGMRLLGMAARHAFAKGERRLFGNSEYAGTTVWYRAVSYAAVWSGVSGDIDLRWDAPGQVAGASLVDALDRIAIVQHIKCSPLRGRGEQSSSMWRNCGEHLLLPELATLRPSRVIVLGTSDNAYAVRSWVMPGTPGRHHEVRVSVGKRRARIAVERRNLQYGPVDVLVVPHPAAPGGCARALLKKVHELVGGRERCGA